MSAIVQLWAMADGGLAQTVADRGLVQTPPAPSVSGTLAPQVGIKCWHHSSDQGVPTPGQKESDIMKVAGWAYQKAHRANFKQEGSYDLSSVF